MSNEQKSSWLSDLFRNPKVKYGGYASLITFAAVVVVIIVNVLIAQLGLQLDMTEHGVYTLSDQTKSVIDSLDRDVTITVLTRRNQEPVQIMEALDRYAQASSRIRVETLDADTNPGFVAQYDPDGQGLGNGSVIVATDRDYRTLSILDLYSIDSRNPQAPVLLGLNVEKRITNALVYLATGRTPIIYQTIGRGEPDIASVLSQFADDLDTENYELRTINLIQAPQVPEDGTILLMLGPRSDISDGEAQKIRDFLERGGRAVFVVGVILNELPNLDTFLAGYGLSLPYGIIIEADPGFRTENPFQLVPKLLDHAITEALIEDRSPVLMPFGRPIEILPDKPRDVTIDPIAQTSDQSYLRTNLANQDPSRSNEDLPGPFVTAVGVTQHDFSSNEEVTRIAVIGSVELFNPLYYGYVPGNKNLILNTLGWVRNQQELSIRMKSTFQLPLQMTGAQILIFGGIFILVIPIGILIAGLVVWLRRRNR